MSILDSRTDGLDDSSASPAREAGPARPLQLATLFSADPNLCDKTLSIGERLRIGRTGSPDLALPIQDSRLSRLHATLRTCQDGRSVEIEDRSSRNGTFVD